LKIGRKRNIIESREFLPKAEKQNNRHAQPSMREFSQKIIYIYKNIFYINYRYYLTFHLVEALSQVQKQKRLNPRAHLGLSLFFCMAQQHLFHSNQEKFDGVLQPM